MSPQRCAILAVFCGTLVLNGWIVARLAGLGSPDIENGGARIAVDTPRATANAKDTVDGVSAPDTGMIDAALPDPREVPPPARSASASTPDPAQNDVEPSAPSVEVAEIGKSVGAALPDRREMPPPARIASTSTADPVQNDIEASAPPDEVAGLGCVDAALPEPRAMLPPARIASASSPDPTQNDVEAPAPSAEVAGSVGAALPDPQEMPPPAKPPARLVSLFRSAPLEEDLKPAVRAAETPNECLVAEICIDDYLWSFYEQTPK